jgi:hypothetical protein
VRGRLYAGEANDMISRPHLPIAYGNSPRVVFAARTLSRLIAIAAVRLKTLSRFARDHLIERPIENLILPPGYFLFFPEQLPQIDELPILKTA